MLNSFTNRYQEFKKNKKDMSSLRFAFLVVDAGIRLFLAKIYLWNCQKVGRMVTVNKKPLVVNNGYIELGDDVRIWSNINITKLFVEKGGILKIGPNARINGCHISVSK